MEGRAMPNKQQLLDIIGIQSQIAQYGPDLGPVMNLVVERTLTLLHADGAVVEIAEGEEMVYRASAGIAAAHLGLRLKRNKSLSGLCVQMGQTILCNDVESDPRADLQACRRIGLRSMIVMPLRHKDVTVGVLKVLSRTPQHFTSAHVTLLGLLSELISASMFYAGLYDYDQLLHRATHDQLTGLPNRALFMDHLRSLLDSANAPTPPTLTVLMIDMDGFKGINDQYGHRIGDAALCEFGHRLKTALRPCDTVARLGGDEFGAILYPVPSRPEVHCIVAQLMQHIESPFLFEDQHYLLRASIGAAYFPDDGKDLETLMEIADQRMYAVKKEHHQRQKPVVPRQDTCTA